MACLCCRREISVQGNMESARETVTEGEGCRFQISRHSSVAVRSLFDCSKSFSGRAPLFCLSSSFKTRNNHSFLNRVSFRRRTPARDSSTSQTNHMNTNASIKSAPNATVAAMRSCIDTLSDTASISPPASVILPHEGSSSGKILFRFRLPLGR